MSFASGFQASSIVTLKSGRIAVNKTLPYVMRAICCFPATVCYGLHVSVELPPPTNVAAMKPTAGNQVPNRLPRGMADEIARYHTLIQCIRDAVGNQSSAQQCALTEHLEIIHPMMNDTGRTRRCRHGQTHPKHSGQNRNRAVCRPNRQGKRVNQVNQHLWKTNRPCL